jgi:hypothetical protein
MFLGSSMVASGYVRLEAMHSTSQSYLNELLLSSI